MNDSLDDMHSDRDDGIIPSVKEIAAMILLWIIVMLFLSFGFAGCLSS